jgi:hypothetical protein
MYAYHRIHRSVNHTPVQLDDLVNGVDLLEVDGFSPYLGCSVETLLDTVDET